jgi:hypothetical protein
MIIKSYTEINVEWAKVDVSSVSIFTRVDICLLNIPKLITLVNAGSVDYSEKQ